MPAVLNRILTYVGKAEYLDDWKTRHLFPALGMIPIDRRGGDHAKAALETAKEVLRSGELFGIYPEGTRSRTGKLHKGHTGAARLAVETGAPLIPVGLVGTAAIQPPEAFMPKFGKTVGIRFGRPISVERYCDRIGDRNMYRELTDEVMFEIQELTGLEYVHEYAGASDRSKVASVPAGTAIGPSTAGQPGADEVLIDRERATAALAQRPLRPLDDVLTGS